MSDNRKDKDEIPVARFPEHHGALMKEKPSRKLMRNIKEGIQKYREELKTHGDPMPIETVQVNV